MTSKALTKIAQELKAAYAAYPPAAVAPLFKILESAVDAIDTYIDRPAEERDALKVAFHLAYMPEFTQGTLPKGYDQYGNTVKSVLEELLLHRALPNTHPVSQNAAQFGYVAVLAVEKTGIDALKATAQVVELSLTQDEITADDVQELRQNIDAQRQVYEQSLVATANMPKPDSGQPRLEQAARESQERQIEFANGFFKDLLAKLDAFDPEADKTADLAHEEEVVSALEKFMKDYGQATPAPKKPKGPQR